MIGNLVIPPWARALAVLALVTAVVAAIYAYGQQQLGLGQKSERTAWLARDNAELTAANTRIKVLQEEYRKREQGHAAALAAVSTQYQQELIHAKAEKDRVIAGLRTGAVRLRIPIAGPLSTTGDRAAALGTGTAGRDGETRADLSTAASEFLVGLASEADEVAHQLGACQAVINADRKTGDGNNGGR